MIGTVEGRCPEGFEAHEFYDRRALLRAIGRGEIDTVAVREVTDLALSFAELTVVLDELRARNATLHCFHGGEDIGPSLQVVGQALSDLGRTAVIAKMHAGRDAALDAGVKVGRRREPVTKEQIERLTESGVSKSRAAEILGISRRTLYRRLDE